MSGKNSEDRKAIDSFWDIESLIPKKSRKISPRPRDVSAVEFEVGGRSNTPAPPSNRAIPNSSDGARVSKVLFTYEPKDSLIRSVTVSSYPRAYNFYDRFLSDAEKYFDVVGEECEFVPFFSYIPQYSKLSQKQLSRYLYFRECVRRGEFPETDLSYILLLVYEIINLPERVPPETGLSMMTDMWLEYRGKFPQLDKYLSEWVADYCMINRLPPPLDKLDPVLNKIAERASFKEFYLSGARDDSENGGEVLARALERFASSYSWRSSRALTEENRPTFKRHIQGALAYLLENAELSGARPVPRTLSRDAYAASLCSHSIKRRLDIEYLSFEQSIELCAVVTAAVKYSENRIRAHLGIKSKLKIAPLPEDIRLCLERYFDRELGAYLSPAAQRAAAKTVEIPEYEKFYDAPSTGFDLDRAKKIEMDSWTVTRMLEADVEPEEEEEILPVAPTEKVSAPTAELSGYAAVIAALDGEELEFFLRAYRGESQPKEILCDAVADAINEKAVDLTGDVILEDNGNGYEIIEDYIEDISPYIERS